MGQPYICGQKVRQGLKWVLNRLYFESNLSGLLRDCNKGSGGAICFPYFNYLSSRYDQPRTLPECYQAQSEAVVHQLE